MWSNQAGCLSPGRVLLYHSSGIPQFVVIGYLRSEGLLERRRGTAGGCLAVVLLPFRFRCLGSARLPSLRTLGGSGAERSLRGVSGDADGLCAVALANSGFRIVRTGASQAMRKGAVPPIRAGIFDSIIGSGNVDFLASRLSLSLALLLGLR